MKMLLLLLPLIFLFPVSATHSQPQQAEKNLPQKILDEVAFTQHIGRVLPRTLLRDAYGIKVELTELAAEQPLILLLAWFDCPHLCPTLLDQLAEATAALPLSADDYQVAVVNIDPRANAASAPELARQLRERHGETARNWQLLTGDAAAIDSLAQSVGFHYVYDAGRKSFAHPAGLVIVAPGGVVSHYLLRMEPQQPDLRLALIEASGGRLGSQVDQLLLRCYHFDPQNGRYSFAVVRLLQVIGSLFALTLFIWLFTALRRRQP